MGEQFENNYSTQLNGAIDDDDTTLTVDAAPVTMTASFRIRIDSEIIHVGAVSGLTFTDCVRGAEGTTAASHSDDAPVTHVLTAHALLASQYDGYPERFSHPGNEEFDTALSGWTTTGGSFTIGPTQRASHVILGLSAANGQSRNFTKPLPVGLVPPYTATAKFRDYHVSGENARVTFQLLDDPITVELASIEQMIYSSNRRFTANTGAEALGPISTDTDLYLRFVVNGAGTSVQHQYSRGGPLFFDLGNGATLSAVPELIGISAVTGSEAYASCDWIRYEQL